MTSDPGLVEVQPDPCATCEGDGGWSWTVESYDGRDAEVCRDCPACGGTGLA